MALLINGVKVAGLGGSGRDGKDGDNGVGVPTGGAEGQVLVKNSENDYDTKWENLISIDNTLNIEGSAADAKAVGDALIEINDALADKQNKNVIVYRDSETGKASMTAPQIMEKIRAGENVYYTSSLSGDTLYPYLKEADTGVFFHSNYIDNDRVDGTDILIGDDGTITTETYQLGHLTDNIIHIASVERNRWNDTYTKTETDDLLEAKANVEEPRFSGSMGMNHTGELGWTSVSLGFANEASGMYCFAEGMGNKATGDSSHAEGTGTTASKDAAHAEGYGTVASNVGSHAEGANTVASGYGSHAEGSNTIASIEGQHVEGKYNIDDTTAIHIVGNGTSNSTRSNAHILNLNGEAWFSGDIYTGSTSGTHKDEGSKKLATEEYVDSKIIDPTIIENKKDKDLIVTYTEGSTFGVTHSTQEIYEAIQNGTTVYFQKGTELLNLMEITEDYATFFMFYMNMEGKPQQKVIVIADSSIMLDQDDTYNYATVTQLNDKADKTTLDSYYNKTEVDNLLSSTGGGASDDVLLKTAQTLTDEELAQVRSNLKFIGQDVAGKTFTINGKNIVASPNAEIFGDYINNKCTGQWSIVEGSANIATGRACHVEGAQNQALNDGCHVEGVNCIASGYWSHAEGEYTRVTSYASHAEGSYTKMPDGTTRYGTASGYASHIEGGGCYAQGSCSHSEGLATTTKGNYSHSEGRYTIAGSAAQHVEGVANIEDTESTYIHIAGNGDWETRSNAYHLDWDGNGWFSGDVYVGSTSGINKDEGSKKLATEDFVLTEIEKLSTLVNSVVELISSGKCYVKHDTTGELHRIGLDENGLYTVAQDEGGILNG